MIVYDFEQGSPEWHQIRAGKITGTRLKDVFKSNNLPLVDKLISEMITGECAENFTSYAMQRGKDMEPYAREHYELVNNVKVVQVGFIVHDEYDWLGKSPDGLICSDGKFIHEVEFKCPNTETHVEYIRMNQLPNDYKYQAYSSFLINKDLETYDFVSFDPRFIVKPMYTYTVHRENIQSELDKTMDETLKFWDSKVMKYYDKIIF